MPQSERTAAVGEKCRACNAEIEVTELISNRKLYLVDDAQNLDLWICKICNDLGFKSTCDGWGNQPLQFNQAVILLSKAIRWLL